jgi:hypothetical protein
MKGQPLSDQPPSTTRSTPMAREYPSSRRKVNQCPTNHLPPPLLPTWQESTHCSESAGPPQGSRPPPPPAT